MLKRMFLIAALFFYGVATPGFLFAQAVSASDAQKAALMAAETWLTIVDDGDFDQTFEPASSYFKSLVKKEQWETQISGVRQPLGERRFRNLETQEYKTSLPGAPDGEYYIFVFNSSFENKKSAVETVTVVKDKDNEWRLVGYFIK